MFCVIVRRATFTPEKGSSRLPRLLMSRSTSATSETALQDVSIATVAALNGGVLGGGLELASPATWSSFLANGTPVRVTAVIISGRKHRSSLQIFSTKTVAPASVSMPDINGYATT